MHAYEFMQVLKIKDCSLHWRKNASVKSSIRIPDLYLTFVGLFTPLIFLFLQQLFITLKKMKIFVTVCQQIIC